MTRYISRSMHFVMAAAAGIVAAARHLGRAATLRRRRPLQPDRPPPHDAGGSRRYTFQAVVTIPAPREEAGSSQPGPDWHGVIKAGNGSGRSGGLFSALVSSWELHDGDPAGSARAVATIVAFGPEPADCLPAGESFVLWRGREVGHGVVTRRIFV